MYQIRPVKDSDIGILLNIWLEASTQAHKFVEPKVWQQKLPTMRDVYLPASKVFVFEQDGKIYGFYALHEDSLVALFVAPNEQKKGIGKMLLQHALAQCPTLHLRVYKNNKHSYEFYLAQGFVVDAEQIDSHTGEVEYSMWYNQSHEREE